MFIRSQDATTRKGDNVEIRNYVTSALSDTMSIAAVDLKGPHPKSLNTKSDRAYYILEGTANVEVGSTIFTDEATGYVGLDGLFFRHDSVNHTAGQYSENGVSTNSIESVWAVLKRGVYGVYHQVSKKHLHRYVDEFTFRLNVGNVSRHTLERLDSFVVAVVGKHLTYKELTA